MISTVKVFSLGDDRITRSWLALVWFMFACLIATTPAALVDTRTLWGVSVWWKPVKFEFAFIVHYATLAILAQQLSIEKRNGAVMRLIVWASVIAALMEIVYITMQAARGRHSHFNFETPFEARMYDVMGVGALMIVLATFILGVMIARRKDDEMSGFRLGSVLGLILGSIMTIIFAGYMSTSGSHWVGQAASDANGVPVFGWSREVGDLRPAHFVATHAVQFLPIAGLAADRIAPSRARSFVVLAAAVNVAAASFLFWQALQGAPIIR